MAVVMRMRTLTLVVWWSFILYCSLVGMGDHEVVEIEAGFDVIIVQDQDQSSFCNLTKLEILVCDKGIKNLLPYSIRQQLKRAYESLVEEVEHSGRTVTQLLPEDSVWVTFDLGPAYLEYR